MCRVRGRLHHRISRLIKMLTGQHREMSFSQLGSKSRRVISVRLNMTYMLRRIIRIIRQISSSTSWISIFSKLRCNWHKNRFKKIKANYPYRCRLRTMRCIIRTARWTIFISRWRRISSSISRSWGCFRSSIRGLYTICIERISKKYIEISSTPVTKHKPKCSTATSKSPT